MFKRISTYGRVPPIGGLESQKEIAKALKTLYNYVGTLPSKLNEEGKNLERSINSIKPSVVQRTTTTAAATSGITSSSVEFVTETNLEMEGGAMSSVVIVNTGEDDRTITLPDPSTTEGEVVVKKGDTGSGIVRIVGTIDGEDAYELVVPYNYVRLLSDKTQWYVIGNN